MTHSFTCQHGENKFSKGTFQDYECHKTSPHKVDSSLFVHKRPDFLSHIIAERKKQIDLGAQSIHVNPKFLSLNQQNRGGINNGVETLCTEATSRSHHVGEGLLHSKQSAQGKNVGVSLSCISRNQDWLGGVNQQEAAHKCSNNTKSNFGNKIVLFPNQNRNAVTNNGVNQSVNVSCRNLQSKSVYINRNFTQPRCTSAVESGSVNPHPCVSSKVATSVHINPRFKLGVDPQFLKGRASSHGKDAQLGSLHNTCTRAKLVDRGNKRVYVNPKFAAAKQQACKEPITSGRPMSIISPDKMRLLADKNKNSVLGLLSARKTAVDSPKSKVKLNTKVSQGDGNLTDCLKNTTGKKIVVQNVLHKPSITDVTSTSKALRRNSLILLSKTKLIRRNVGGVGRKSSDEQQTIVVSSSSRKLVKSSPSSSSKLTKSVESTVKQSPRLLPRSPVVKAARSVRSKFKIVRNTSPSYKQAQLVQAMRTFASSLPKQQKHCSNSGDASNVVREEKQAVNLSTPRRNIPRNSLIILSKTKLIRRGAKCTVRKYSRDHQTVTISNNARKLVRRRSSQNVSPRQRSNSVANTVKLTPRVLPPPPAVKVARSVRTKYKYIRSLSDQKNKRAVCGTPPYGSRSRFCLESKYNIDRRAQPLSRAVRKIRKYGMNYPRERTWLRPTRAVSLSYRKRAAMLRQSTRKPAPSSLVWRNENYVHLKRAAASNRRLQRMGRRSKSNDTKRCRNASNMVRIGGVLYKRSVNKLTRTSSGGGRVTAEAKVDKVVPMQGHIVHIRGNKFLMEPTGKTMRRIDAPSVYTVRARKDSAKAPITRIDIGGVTFLQKSQNVLIRTDYHRARNILSQAKQRSIATLMQKRKKNNQPCVFYQRFGKCLRKEKGTCQRVHDPKQIALCKKFLQGCCHVAECPLSHNVVPEKMATCRFFLEGVCIRDNCPYLHVKLNSKAGICLGFLQGYCAQGDKCQKRHMNLCPEFDKLGECSRGKFCPYPHKVGVKRRAKKRNFPKLSTVARPKDVSSARPVAHRYYEGPSTSKQSDAAERAEATSTETDLPKENDLGDEPDELVVACKRRKLEPMPHYIAFA